MILFVKVFTSAFACKTPVIQQMPPKELELLFFLASNGGKVYTREQLLKSVWGFDFFGDTRTVDVHIKRIREKLTNRQGWDIVTCHTVGYMFTEKKD